MSNVADRILSAVMQRKIDGAQRYAAAEKSDPFAFSRAMTHIRNDICRTRPDGEAADYDAEMASEMRKLPDGTEYQVSVYRSLKRP
jgi:hypothetical protein